MHCALLIEDIISRILDEVDVKSRWALARTCRSFTEPALDAVWATRTDAWALGGLMPKDLWTVNGFAGGVDVDEDYPAAYVLSFTHGVDVASVRDFGDRFMYHAKRVRDFVIDHTRSLPKGDYYVDPYVVAAWAKRPHLFPQLRTLTASMNCLTRFTPFGNTFDLLVQAPCLTTISVNFGDAMYDLPETTEQHLLEACPQLETLELEYSERQDNNKEPWMKSTRHVPGLLHQMITRAARLRGLRLAKSPMHFTTLLHVARIPELRILVLGEIIDIPPDLTSLPASGFRALRALRIHDTTSHTRLARSLVQCCWGSPLMELHVDLGQGSELNSQDIRDLFRFIGQHTRLEHLRLSLEWVSVHNDGPFFDALPRLEFLTSLWVTKPVFGQSLVTLDELLRVVSLYPRLVRWHMSRYDKQDGISTSLTGLLHVLRLRPFLRLLPVVINSSEFPSEDMVANFGTHQYGPYLQVSGTSEARAMIAKLLPRVKTITYSYQQRGLLEEALKPFEAYV